MSTGSVQKYCGFIALSASVISPSFVNSAGDCLRNGKKCPKMLYSVMVKNRKVTQNPNAYPDQHQQLITSS